MSTTQTYTGQAIEARPRSLSAILSPWAVPLGVAVIWMLLIWSVHRDSPRTLVSFHGLLHAAIAEKFTGPAEATFPPENPFFAGQPVAYYWFFHFLSAQLVRLFGLNVFHAMEALILLATGMLVVVAVGLGRRLFNSTLAGVLMSYLVMAGTNPFGILFASYKVVRKGMPALEDNPEYLWGVVHPLYSMIRYNDYGGLYGPLLNFFLNITSRPAALASLLLVAFCLYRAISGRGVASWVWLGLSFALTTALSPIIGLTAGGSLGVGIISLWLWNRRRPGMAGPRIETNTVIAAGLAICAGILIAAPTYYHLILGPSSSNARFWLFSVNGLKNLLTVALSILPLMAIALLGLLWAPQEKRQYLAMLFISALALLALNAAFVLPAGNQSNMFHAAAVLLSIPAAGAVLQGRRSQEPYAHSTRRAAVIALIFLPTLLALLASYVSRPPLPASFESTHIERLPRDSDLALLYGWMRNETDPQSVFIIDPRDRAAVCGNTAELPAMTGRAIFTEHSRHYLAEPYPDSKMRYDIAVRLVSGAQPGDSDRAYLSALNRPVYILSHVSEGEPSAERLKGAYGPPVFEQGKVKVYKVSASAR